jgi:hypothetical protein
MNIDIFKLKEIFLSLTFLFFLLWVGGYFFNYFLTEKGIGKKAIENLKPGWKRFCNLFIDISTGIWVLSMFLPLIGIISGFTEEKVTWHFYFGLLIAALFYGLVLLIIRNAWKLFFKRIYKSNNEETIKSYLIKSSLVYFIFLIIYVMTFFRQFLYHGQL